jgi:hypothetical protein
MQQMDPFAAGFTLVEGNPAIKQVIHPSDGPLVFAWQASASLGLHICWDER